MAMCSTREEESPAYDSASCDDVQHFEWGVASALL